MGAENPSVVSVFLNEGHQLQTTRSWEFLGLESNGVVSKGSIWEKASYGEGLIIAGIDTGHFLFLFSNTHSQSLNVQFSKEEAASLFFAKISIFFF